MEMEASPFESTEMLATFLASTPLLSNSWKLCDSANSLLNHSFVSEQSGAIGYVAFSGAQPVSLSPTDAGNLEVLNSVFSCLQHENEEGEETEEPVMVHGGFLRVFLSIYDDPSFQYQISGILEKSKSIVITGHSAGGPIASLCALWLLCYLETESITNVSVLCITFGSTLVGNESLSRAILRQRWTGNFCHVVSKHDIVPRLLFAPLPLLIPHLHSLLQFWQLSMTSPHFGPLSANLPYQTISDIFTNVAASLQQLIQTRAEGVTKMTCAFWPFGNYFFCSQDGAICIDNAISVVKMMHLLLSTTTTTPISSIEDHLKYGDYVSRISFQFLNKRSFLPDDFPESSYEAGVSLALHSSGLGSQDPVAQDCLKLARRMGRTPSLNCANLAIRLSKITPYRAEIEWYKACCDKSDDGLGYYDSFKQRGGSKRDYKVNMNRHKLNQFWDNVIKMLENNELPLDFERRAKWINASQFYKLLVEPLDIAEYYRTGMQVVKGHYVKHGRERRYKIFDRWWNDRTVKEEDKKKKKRRSKFASLTQDTCFWAKVEEAREWLDNLRSEIDPRNQNNLWDNINVFERYARELVERKEVSKDVLAKNSSYCMWVKDYQVVKAQVRPQFPTFMDGEVVP
ncbi:lipase-like PAD4 [Euphorbia lathyris]|uniref:lipase-like PAD4 n=1 Tax=Euphorbia lathyris TaxID=212925 RepID=UPI003313F375